ncbi:MAG: type II toxin-antitoxin system RelE/ParE family toxin [Treponema sp.]|nr:type II toxin-antitoxin system RelE/ParE family toxin [Treponema sp.]
MVKKNGMYQVVLTEKAFKSLQTIPKADIRIFFMKLEIIAKNPYAALPFVKRLKNSQHFRFRFGNYRGVYNINDDILTITVIDAAHRKDIYRG